MKFYHYTSPEGLRKIQSNDPAKNGLRPVRMFANGIRVEAWGLPQEALERCTFGLLSPLDEAWCKNLFHFDEPLLETMLKGVGILDDERNKRNRVYLIEVSTLPTDDVFVADYATHLNREYTGASGDPKITGAVKREYWNSRIRLSDYIPGTYQVTEVLSFTRIPLERLHVADEYDRFELINRVREIGRFAPHLPDPPLPEVKRPAYMGPPRDTLG